MRSTRSMLPEHPAYPSLRHWQLSPQLIDTAPPPRLGNGDNGGGPADLIEASGLPGYGDARIEKLRSLGII